MVARHVTRLAWDILRLFCSTGDHPPKTAARLTMTTPASSPVAAPTSPPERLVPESTRVVAVGDVHGDVGVLVRTLLMAGLVDAQLQWTGGDATLVQLGDVLDRGDSERECWDLLQRLKSDAPKAGGRVVCMIGNHEAMNVLGDSRRVGVIHRKGETSFGPDREHAWRQGGPLAKELAECFKQMRRFLLDGGGNHGTKAKPRPEPAEG